MVDQHSETLIAGGGVVAVAGGTFMLIGTGEASQTHRMWTNLWFDLGLAFVVLGIIAVVVGLYLHFRRGDASAAGAPVSPARTLADRPSDASGQPGTQDSASDPPMVVTTAQNAQFQPDLVISRARLRSLIEEGAAMQGRVADRTGPLALPPPGLAKSVTEWKATVSAALAPRPELLDQFQAPLAPALISFQGPAGKLHDELSQRINVLKAIVRNLEP